MAVIVKAACAVVKGVGYLYRGAEVPDSADAADVQRLLDEGLLAEDGAAPQQSSPKSIDEMTGAELKAYAAERSIDLGSAKKVDDIRAAVKASEAPESKPLADMTNDELAAEAARLGIEVPEDVTERDDLITLIEQ